MGLVYFQRSSDIYKKVALPLKDVSSRHSVKERITPENIQFLKTLGFKIKKQNYIKHG